jgi:ABC-type multidrug transport system permease subunit
MIVDVPLFAVQTLVFSSIYYFLLGLNPGARYFFTFWFTVFTLYMAIANMYRMIGEFGLLYGRLLLTLSGSWSPDVRFSDSAQCR